MFLKPGSIFFLFFSEENGGSGIMNSSEMEDQIKLGEEGE